MNKIKILTASKKDAKLIYTMVLKLISEGKKIYPLISLNQKKKRLIFNVIKRSVGKRGNRYIIAKIGGKTAGYAIGVIIKTNTEFFDYHNFLPYDYYGYISDVFVEKRFRHIGISGKLVTNLMAWFKRNRIKYLELHTLSKNKIAIRAFKSMHFVEYEKMMQEILK